MTTMRPVSDRALCPILDAHNHLLEDLDVIVVAEAPLKSDGVTSRPVPRPCAAVQGSCFDKSQATVRERSHDVLRQSLGQSMGDLMFEHRGPELWFRAS
jgi:hypothetical protein